MCLIGEGDAICDVGRLERRRTLDQRRAGDEGRREDEAAILAEHVEAARPLGRLNADGNRKGARFEHRVGHRIGDRSEEHTSELQSLMRISYAVFCLKKKKINQKQKLNDKITRT